MKVEITESDNIWERYRLLNLPEDVRLEIFRDNATDRLTKPQHAYLKT